MFKRTLYISQTSKDYRAVDQGALNYVLQRERSDLKFSPKYVALNKAMYPSGEAIHIEKWNNKLQVYPMVAHFNFVVGNAPKKKLMKEFNMWYVGEEFAEA